MARKGKRTADAHPHTPETKRMVNKDGSSEKVLLVKGISSEQETNTPAVNGKFFARLTEWIQIIESSTVFSDIAESIPLPIDEDAVDENQGCQAPYDKDEYPVAIRAGLYRCAGNLWWINMMWRVDAGVPLAWSRLEDLKNYFFKEPTLKFPVNLVICMKSGADPMEHKGDLHCITPCEFLYAFIWAVAGAIESKADENVLARWKQSILTMPMAFEILDPESDIHARAKALRDLWSAAHDTVTYTPSQKIWSLIIFKKRHEGKSGKLSVKDLCEKYNAGTEDVPGQEPLAESWIDAGMTVWERMLSKDRLRDIILAQDEKYGLGGPLNSVYKLNEVIKIARTEESIEYSLKIMQDLVDSAALTCEDVAIRTLNGKGMGGKGLLHLIIYKEQATAYLFHYMSEHAFPEDFQVMIRNTFDKPENYRAKFGFEGEDMDITFVGQYPQSAQRFLRLIEAYSYTYVYSNYCFYYCAHSDKS